MSISPEAGSSLLETIVDTLAGRRALVVLDNCEHVIDAAAEIAAAIRSGAPRVSIVATSREPLGVTGEQLWPVPPLDPALEAVELFCDRARAVQPSFELSDTDRDRLVGLCASLDGIPLAVELAAGRVRSMTITDLTERLDDRFRLLRASRQRRGDQRHQTLRATVEWSYQLLEPDERLLFDRLSVFAGDFDLTAAEAVCADDDLDELDIVDLLDALVDRSMVQTDQTGSHARFSLLETLRQYGTEQLAGRDELDTLRDRHLTHYTRVADQAREWFQGARNHGGRELFETEWDNLRAALEHAEACGDEASATAIITDTFWYGFFGAHQEHREWVQRRVDASEDDEAWMLCIAGYWAFALGDQSRATDLGRAAAQVNDSPDDSATAIALQLVSAAAWYSGRRDEAIEADAAAKQMGAALHDDFNAAITLSWIHPTVAVAPDEAPGVVAAARQRVEGLANDTIEAHLAYQDAAAWLGAGDDERALREYRRTAELAVQAKARMGEGAALAMLATQSPFVSGDEPADTFYMAIDRLDAINARGFLSWAFTGLAHWWATIGNIDHAARIVGFLDANDAGGNQTVADLRGHATELVDAQPDTAEARAEGAAMTCDEIVRYCLDRLESRA